MQIVLAFFVGVFMLALCQPRRLTGRQERLLVLAGCLAVASALLSHRLA